MIRKGDHVEILPAFRDPGDEEFTWIALSDEENGRIDIQPVDIELRIKPVYTVSSDQIRIVGGSDSPQISS